MIAQNIKIGNLQLQGILKQGRSKVKSCYGRSKMLRSSVKNSFKMSYNNEMYLLKLFQVTFFLSQTGCFLAEC